MGGCGWVGGWWIVVKVVVVFVVPHMKQSPYSVVLFRTFAITGGLT